MRSLGAQPFFSSAFVRLSSMVLAVGLSILIARYLAVEDFGRYNLVVSIITVLAVILNLGFDKWLLKMVPLQAESARRLLSITLLPTLGLYLAMLPVLAIVLHFSDYRSEAMIGFAMLGFLCLANALAGLIKACELPTWSYLLSDMARVTINTVLVVLCIVLYDELSLVAVLLAYAGSLLAISLLLAGFNIRRVFPVFTKASEDELAGQPLLKRGVSATRESLPFLVSGTANFLNNHADLLMVGLLSSPVQVAGYAVCNRAVSVITALKMVANNVFAPRFSRTYAKEHTSKLVAQYATTRKRMLLLAIVGAIGLIPASFVLLLWGDSYIAFRSCLLVLGIAYLISFAVAPIEYLFSMTGNEKLERNINVGQLVLNLSLNAVLIPEYGALGAAWGTAIAVTSAVIFRVVYYQYVLRPRWLAET